MDVGPKKKYPRAGYEAYHRQFRVHSKVSWWNPLPNMDTNPFHRGPHFHRCKACAGRGSKWASCARSGENGSCRPVMARSYVSAFLELVAWIGGWEFWGSSPEPTLKNQRFKSPNHRTKVNLNVCSFSWRGELSPL